MRKLGALAKNAIFARAVNYFEMLEVYWTKNTDVHRKVGILLERKLGKCFEIERNENGKPYIEGNPLYFSLSHSQGYAMIAICDRAVGIDLQFYNKNFEHVLSRFSEREQKWIDGNSLRFFQSWVSKEAYIKMIGGTLAHDLKRLEYFDDNLYCDGEKVDGVAASAQSASTAYALCAEGYTREQVSTCPVKQFRLKKGEKI